MFIPLTKGRKENEQEKIAIVALALIIGAGVVAITTPASKYKKDATGHGKGFTHNNPEYQEAFRTGDAYAYEDISAIYERATFDTEDRLIIITSDHGSIGTDHGGSSIQERMTFVAMNKEFR